MHTPSLLTLLLSLRPCIFSAVLLALPGGFRVSADEPTLLTNWTYTAHNRTFPNYADLTGKQLNDGVMGAAAGKTAIYEGGTIVIDIALEKPSVVTGVTVHAHRHNGNYMLERWTVAVKQAGNWVVVGEGKGFWGAFDKGDHTLTVEGLKAQTDSLRLTFYTPHLLSTSEIKIFGTAASAASDSAQTLAFQKSDDATGREVDTDGDGVKEVVLENRFVRLIVQPDEGGVCTSLVDKRTNVDLVTQLDRTYGLLRDQLWDPYYFFADRFYSSKVQQDKDTATAELTTNGVGGIFSFTRVTKRFEMQKDSPIVRVHWELQNEPSSQTDYAYAIWFHNTLGVKGRHNFYYAPTEDGVQEFNFLAGHFRPQQDLSDLWFHKPSRGWTAIIAPEEGKEGSPAPGLGIKVDYKYLNCFYNWVGLSSIVATHEWRLNKQLLKAGQKFATDITLVPLTALPRVDSVFDTGAAAIAFTGGKEDATNPRGPVQSFAAGEEVKGKLMVEATGGKAPQSQLRYRRLPDGTWNALTGGAFALKDLAAGLYVVNAQINGLDKEAVEVERPFKVGETQLAYRLEPKEKRVGYEEEAVARARPGHELTDKFETPHIKWAKPYSGGRLKGLVLCDDRYSREVIELAQRLDLDFDYVKFFTTLDKEWLYHGDNSITTLDQAQKRLKERLAKDHDFILLSGFKWDHHFTPELRKLILDKVRAGTGLILIQPDGFDSDSELRAIFGGKSSRSFYDWRSWKSPNNHYITQGLPWDLFPKTRRMVLDPKPSGEVLATFDDGYPLILTNPLGKGRVVTLAYDVLTHDLSYRGYAGLIPILSYRGGFLLPEFSKMTYPYWELQYALLCRCCVWAAGKELGNVSLRDTKVQVAPAGNAGSSALALSVSLDNVRQSSKLNLVARLFDRYGNLIPLGTKKEESLALSSVQTTSTGSGGDPSGATVQMSTTISADLPAGQNLLQLQALNSDNQIVAWAATTVQVDSLLSLEGIEIPQSVLKPQESVRNSLAPWDPESPLRATIKVKANPKPPGKTNMDCRLVDNHERLLGIQQIEVEVGKTEYPVEFPLRDLVNSGLELRCQLMHDGKLVDSASARAIAPRPRVWKPLQFTSWGGVFYWRSEYLEKELGKLVDDLGVDVSFEGGYELQNRRDISNYWNNIAFSELDILRYGSKDVLGFPDEKFAEKSTGYQKTKDKKFLVREPCLNDPVWREKIRQRIQDDVKKAEAVAWAHDYCMGDEMSLTYYTAYHDYCWSDYCLTKFRETLKAKYGTVEKLNAAWETQFTDWNAVVPMALAEVKNRPNAAPWAEHRQFMDTTLQVFFQFIQKAIREVDPQARCGLSGTQAPEAGNGMDWWKMCSAFNFDHTYNTGWSEEMRRSFAPATGLEWSPYYAGYWQHGRRIEYNLFACLLHDTTGISAWYTPLFFYGDMTFSECGKDTRDLLAELKTGIWDQFRAVKRQHDGIAILYSHPSIEAALLLGKEEAISAHRSAWVWMLEGLGLQYNFVSYHQLAKGELAKGAYRVLVLPMAIALSPGEVKAIRDFVANGGTVIADAYCGLMDDVCRRQNSGLLDDLFGIKRPQEIGKPTQPGATLDASLKVKDNSAKLCIAEPNLTSATAKALASGESDSKPPALFTRKAGKGNAWYLNLDLSQYETERKFKSATERAMHQILLASLASANVRPRFGMSYESDVAPHVEVVRYGAGDTEYVGFLREYSDSEKDEILNVTLPSPCFVADLRLHRNLGRVTNLKIPIAPGECRLYSLSTKELPTPTFRLLTSKPVPGQRVEYEINAPGASPKQPRVVHVTVVKPDGSQPREYTRNLTLTGAPKRGIIPLALNDAAGEWKIETRDIASGKKATTQFRLEP